MSRQKGMSEEDFAKMRQMLELAEYATKEVPLASIKLTERSFSKNEVLIDEQPVKVHGGFFSKLAGLLQVNISLTRDFLKNQDGKLAVNLMNAIRTYKSSHGSSNVLLVANPTTKELVDICDPKRFRRMTNSSVLDITSRILNDSPSLTLETVDFNPHTGRASINLLNHEEIGFAKAGPDEFFRFGFSIVQTGRQTFAEGYNQRLVCSNGMRTPLGGGTIGGGGGGRGRGPNFAGGFSLRGSSAEDVRAFLQNVENMKKNGFIPGSFKDTIQLAMTTKASFAEIESALGHAQRLVTEEIPEIKKQYLDAIERNYFDGYRDTLARLNKAGYNPERLSEQQKSKVKSGQSVWDVVNSLTYLGSNNTGIPISNMPELKFQGGQLFSKGESQGFDHQNAELSKI